MFCPGVSLTYSYMQNPCQKEKCDFKAKIAGWRIRTICVDGCIYKIVYRKTFLYVVQNTKGPAGAEPKICQQKRKWGSWFIVECFRNEMTAEIDRETSLNPLYIVECFRSKHMEALMSVSAVLIHCMSWNAFGGWHRRGLINQGFQRAFFCQTF